MIGNELKESRAVSLSEVLALLEKRKKRGPLGYEQQTSYDYCEKFTKLSLENVLKMVEELTKNEKIDDKLAIKIADVLPEKKSLIKIILAKERCDLNDKEQEEVLEIVQKYKKPTKEEKPKKAKKAEEPKEATEKEKPKKEKKPKKTKTKKE